MKTLYTKSSALWSYCLVAMALLLAAPTMAQTTFGPFSASPALSIPDDTYNGTLGSMGSSAIPVSGVTGTSVINIEVDVNINHTWVGDLVLKLQAPNGNLLTLASRPGAAETVDDGNGGPVGTNSYWLGSTVTFTDLGAADAELLNNPFTGTYFPNPGATVSATQTFASLFGGTMNGTWTLYVGDVASLDLGTLNNWAIRITSVSPLINVYSTVAVEDGNGDCSDDAEPLTSSITVAPGTDVCYFYTVENIGDVALGLHDLSDDIFGVLATGLAYDLQPTMAAFVAYGPVTINADVTNIATWTAYNAGPIDVATNTASATVLVSNVPSNDLCSGAIAVACGSVTTGNTVSATASGLPAGVSMSEGIWYSLVGTGGDITLSTCSAADFDTEIAVLTGTCGAFTVVGGNDDAPGCPNFTSEYTFTSSIGTTYYLYVGDWSPTVGAGGGAGTFDLSVTCAVLPCDMSAVDGQWPTSAITPDAGGAVTTISGSQYAGSEYSIITGIASGATYELTHANGAYITVREGAAAGPVLASGYSPLQFTATSTSDVYVHWTADNFCTPNSTGLYLTTVQNLGIVCDMSSADGQWPTSAITPNAGGAVTTIAANQYVGSEYSVITGVMAFHEYQFTHASGSYITVRSGAVAGSVVGSGYSPLTVQVSNANDLYVHWTVDDQCTVDGSGSVLTTVQDLGIPACDNTSASGQWPTSAITPDAGGAVTTIATNMYAGSEYSVITGVVAGEDYILSHAFVGSYVTVREGAVAGPVVAAGFSPLTVTATSSADLYVHWTADEFCATNANGSYLATVQLVVVLVCDATAGTLAADATPVMLVGGSAVISATEVVAPNVPSGFAVAYVLTSGAGLVIIDLAASPSFTVTAAGDYTIHTLVYDPADQATLLASATGFDVNALLIQGGGSLCGALDVTGAPIVVEDELVGINEALNSNLMVYPNPNNGQFIVGLNDLEGKATLNIVDMMGRNVYSQVVTVNGTFRQSIDLNVAAGSYLLQVITDNGVATRKVELH